MKIGNIAPRVGIEPTSLTFWASMLTITPPRFPDATMATRLCSSLPERLVQITTLVTRGNISLLRLTKLYIHIQGQFTIHIHRVGSTTIQHMARGVGSTPALGTIISHFHHSLRHIYLSVCLSVCMSIHASMNLSIYLHCCLSICMSIYVYMCYIIHYVCIN